MTPIDTDDLIEIHDDDAPLQQQLTWRVLIVDDDPEVHAATRFVLRGQELLGRQIELHSAFTAAEAGKMLAGASDYAVVLLDVVMEQPDAGLRLVQIIRQDLNLQAVRVILRTGQPGYAPELEVIRRYDINDYRTKSELTQTRLMTSLISALRGYEQIRSIESSRRGLSQIIHATRDLLSSEGLHRFAGGVLTQLGSFLGLPAERGVVVISPSALGRGAETQADLFVDEGPLQVVAATGPYAPLVDLPAESIEPGAIWQQLSMALAERRNVFSPLGCALYCNSRRHQLAVFIDTAGEIDAAMRELLEVFTENIALCSDNLSLLEQMQRAAYVDTLTGLPSRLRLLQRLSVYSTEPAGHDVALLMLDVDDFNTHVETLGPVDSDALLSQFAQRLQSLMADIPALPVRMAADVFAVHGPRQHLGPDLIARLCSEEFNTNGLPIRLTASAGLALATDAAGPAGNLVAAAFTALKLAKREQRQGYVVYQADMGTAALRRASLLRAMYSALQAGEFRLALQPQVRMADGAVLGVEALLRWQPAGGPPISPVEFIPIAESSGLILPLGAWVMDEACRQLAEIKRRTGLHLRMAINVSQAQWRDSNLLNHLQRATERSGVALQQIEIELTESLAMREIDTLLPRLQALRALGMRVALDDFGTGFSSLAYLQHMPIDQLKIDRSFVDEIGRSRRGEEIARTIVRLGAMLDLEVVAEGVETREQEIFLQGLGCDAAQGYLHARPMPLDDLCTWLIDRDRATHAGA
jgi:diguanylate cyclase